VFLVAGVVDGLGQELLGLGDEAGQGVQPDSGVAEPVGRAQAGEVVDRVGEDLEAVVAGGRCGELAGVGEAGDCRQARALGQASGPRNDGPVPRKSSAGCLHRTRHSGADLGRFESGDAARA